MGSKNSRSKKKVIKEPIHKNENKNFLKTKKKNNENKPEYIIEDHKKFNSENKPKTNNDTMKTLNSINNRNPLKSFENKTNEKSIKFYYNKQLKVIKFLGKFDLDSVKKNLKSHFLIEESIDNIFFIDEEEDILILNSNIPDNLTVNLFIRKDFTPKNPGTALKISKNINSNNKSQKPLLKFHWIMENEKMKKLYGDLCIIDKYIYINTYRTSSNPSVSSSSSFTVGTYFFVLRVGSFMAYESLAIVDSETPDFDSGFYSYNPKTFVGYRYMVNVDGHEAKDIAIYIDMEKKKCRFYNYEKKKLLLNGRINISFSLD